MASEMVERELKYEVDEHHAVPDPRGLLADTRRETGDQSLDSMYFDTANRDLHANRVTLRCRTGTADNGWQLKIPSRDTRVRDHLGRVEHANSRTGTRDGQIGDIVV